MSDPGIWNLPRPYSWSEVIHRAGDESIFPAFERERPRIVNNFAASASSGFLPLIRNGQTTTIATGEMPRRNRSEIEFLDCLLGKDQRLTVNDFPILPNRVLPGFTGLESDALFNFKFTSELQDAPFPGSPLLD